jgi:hypothetical protein
MLSDSLVAAHGPTESLRIAMLASLSLCLVTAALYAQVARVMQAEGPLPIGALGTSAAG